jgi:hypothetical protein
MAKKNKGSYVYTLYATSSLFHGGIWWGRLVRLAYVAGGVMSKKLGERGKSSKSVAGKCRRS